MSSSERLVTGPARAPRASQPTRKATPAGDPPARRRLVAVLLVAAAAGGCGFQLRTLPSLPFERIALVGFDERSPMAAELRRALSTRATVVAAPAQAQVVLQAIDDRRDRVIVAKTAAAQVRELTLRQTLRFRVQTPYGRELIGTTELGLARDLTYNETIALAKQQEADELYREMQTDIAGQVMRRLAAIAL
jgi:LPS-assembly lipoprotein